MKNIIYGLVDPRTGQIKYVGKSTTGLKRCYEHQKPFNLKAKNHKTHWIKQLKALDLRYKVIVLEEVDDAVNLTAREVFWIAECRRLGQNLTNSTEGGEGATGRVYSEQTLKLMSHRREEWHQRNPDFKQKVADRCRKAYKTQDGVVAKHCSDCNTWKPLADYGKALAQWDKLRTICKQCAKLRTAHYRSKLK